MEQIHGTCIEIAGRGVLLRGPSGSGKSDLALRLIDGGARLVADDRVDVTVRDGRLFASAPAALAGQIEARGLGIVPFPAIRESALAAVFDLVPGAAIDRVPAPETIEIEGVLLPVFRLDPFAASASAKVRLAARGLARGILSASDEETAPPQ